MKKISVIIPCYNEEEAIPLFYEAFLKETAGMPVEFEFMFVNDGSRDGTLEAFRTLREKDERVHYISFSRNFGKESAMFAGMEAVTGDYVAIMDVDLQDPPALLRDMLKGIEEALDTAAEDFDALLQQYRTLCITLGREIQASGGADVCGLAEDINPDGELIVRDAQGVLHALRTADVSVRGVMGYV